MLTKQNKQYSQGGQSAFPIVALLVGATIWGLLWYPYRLLEQAGVSGPAATVITYLVALLLGLAVFRHKLRTVRILDRETCLLVGIGLSAGWANLAYVLGVLHGEIMRVMLLFYLSPLWTIVFARVLRTFGVRQLHG